MLKQTIRRRSKNAQKNENQNEPISIGMQIYVKVILSFCKSAELFRLELRILFFAHIKMDCVKNHWHSKLNDFFLPHCELHVFFAGSFFSTIVLYKFRL